MLDVSRFAAKRAIVSQWLSNLDINSAYSSLKPGGSPADRLAIARPFPGLYFAGEATSDHIGTMHGAYASGVKAANEVCTHSLFNCFDLHFYLNMLVYL